MPSSFVLTLRTPKEYGLEKFDTDPSIWTATDPSKSLINRYTDDPDRDSVMKIEGVSWKLGDSKMLGDEMYLGNSYNGKGEGAYKDFAVTSGIRYSFSCLYKVIMGTLTIQLYDQTNDASISSIDKTDTAWKSCEMNISAPNGCNVIRIKFLQNEYDSKPGPFYIDDISLNGNALIHDPDSYSRVPEHVGCFHQTLSGRRIYDLRAIHYTFYMGWNFFKEDQYENLRELYYSNELLYFDDGNVPPLSERENVFETDRYDYQGVTNPSSTHKAYFDSSSSLPSAKSDFETTEFTTADYQAIDSDDENYKEIANPDASKYIYTKFLLLSSINMADVKRFGVKVVMSSEDSSLQNLDGGILYAWDGTNWVEMAGNTNNSKSDLAYNTAEAEIAKQFVDSGDNYIRLLLRSHNRRNGANDLNLRVYYVECKINEGLDLTIELSHKAILDEDSDVIWVKNLTKGTTLTLDTDYTIANDRRSVTVLGQSSGDEIEVKYNRCFEVMFASIPEEWLNGDKSDEDRARSAELALQTLSESR